MKTQASPLLVEQGALALKSAATQTSPELDVPAGTVRVEIQRLQHAGVLEEDLIAQEVPVALVYNGISYTVMMTTPTHLEEFALGFSLAEGIIDSPSQIYGIEVSAACRGLQVDIELASECFWKLKEHRRSLAGRTGCGICGVESLDGAMRPMPRVPDTQRFDLSHLESALSYLSDVEILGQLTGCTHAAVWVSPQGEFLGGAEDVGRHVALDKLLGMRAQAGWQNGALVISSRASYEMVQKAATCGIEIMFAVSAPTQLAVEVAKKSGVTLAAFCRPGRASVYSHAHRLLGLGSQHN